MNIPPALVNLLNKTDEGFICFAFMWPAKVLRVTAKADFTTFRVQRFTRTNRDNADPKGSWHTLVTLGDEVPGMMLGRAMEAAMKEQKDLIEREERKAQRIMTPQQIMKGMR